MPESMELAPEVCGTLLRAGDAGRVAVSTPDGPHIVPLNYSVVDDALVFRTSPYSLLGTFARNSLLAFETDYVDHELQRGWSVVARGRCQFVDDPGEIDRIRAIWSPQPWAAGARNLFLRLHWTEISGRRLGLNWNVLDELPGRREVIGRRAP
ncbi:MAG: pyridoxamine 5'-phosphate oxidase family protein [Actinomycetota bacterium]|nr:pyridoxamine 5'-phosphate oxidase family protein [Actinomycetota bacterium]